jgi:hypothetical protein
MSRYVRICKYIQDNWPEEDIMLADGFESALIGFSLDSPASRMRAIYDYDKAITALLRNNDEWHWDDAVEWMDYNVLGSYVGDTTPLFLKRYVDISDETE